MNLVQFILLIGILFYADTINGQIANTTALDPYLHYINITIRYRKPIIIALYQPSTIILPQYGIVLASCYLNISREEVNSTSYSTTDLLVVEITNLNISLFYKTYHVSQFNYEDGSVGTMVLFEFYLAQNGTFILATDAIEVFYRNCNTSNWKDSFTSDSISASATFSSKQTSLISSSLISSSIYTSSFQYIPSISSVASVVSSHFFTTEQVSTPAITSPTLPSSAIELNTTPISVETTSVYSTYVQTQVTPLVASRTVPSISQSAVPTSLAHTTGLVGVSSQSSLIAPTTTSQYVTSDSKSVFQSTTNTTTGIAITQSVKAITSTPFLAPSSSITNVIHTPFLPVLSSSQPVLSQSVIPPQSSRMAIQSITATQLVTADSVFRSTPFLAASSSIPNVIRVSSQIHTPSFLPVLSSSQPAIPSQSASSIHGPLQAITSSAVVQVPSQSQQTSNRTLQYTASSSSNASTHTLTLNTSAVSTSMSLFVGSRIIVDLPSTGVLGSSLSSPVQYPVTSSAFLPSSSIYSTRHIVQPSTRPLVPVSSQTQSVVSLQSSTAMIQQPIIPVSSSIRQPIIPSSSIRQPIIPSSSIRQPIIPSSSIRQPIIPSSSSIRQPIIPSSSSIIRQPIIPVSSSNQQPIIPSSSSIQQPIIPSSSSIIRQPIIPSSSSTRQPIIPSSSSTRQPIIPSSSSIQQPIIPSSSSIIRQPIIPVSSSNQQPIIPSSSISSTINLSLLSSSMVPLTTSFIQTQSSSSFSPAAIYQTTSLLSAVRSLTSAVSRMLTQTAILQASSSVQTLFSNTSTQFVVPTRSVPQQPSAVFNTSRLSSTISTSQLLSTHSINTSTLIDRVQSLTTHPPILSTVLPSASSVQPTTIPQVSPYRHYLIATIEYTLSSLDIGQTDDNINSTITAIAIRYLNLTAQTAIATYSLTTDDISVRVGNLTITAIRSEYDQSTIENIATRRVVFYVTDNTAILLATQAKAVLDTYSIDQWAESTGLQTSSVTFDLYGQIQTSSTLIATMTVSQLSSTFPILNTTVIPITSLTTRPVLATSSTELTLSLIVPSLSSSIRVSQISSTRHSMLTSLSGQIQQSLPSSSLQTPILATQSVSAPVQLMTSSLRDTLITLSSNRSALPIPAPSTALSPVISVTSSLISVLNSTLSSQPLVSSIFPTTRAVQPSLAVTSSGISSVQQLRPNTTSLPAMAPVNSTQFPTSTGFPNASARIMTSSPIISRIATRTSIISMIRNSSSSQIESQINTSSLFPTQRVSISQNSSLQSIPPSSTPIPPIPDYQTLTDFNPGAGYLLQLTLNASETKVNLSREFYVSTELNLINLYSLGLRIAGPSVNNRRKRDVFNTTSQIACGIIKSLTIAANNRLIIVFYISREENGLPLAFVPADTSKYVFDKLEPSNFTAALGYEFLSLSIYEGIFVDPHRLAIIVGTILGCCSLVMLIFLVVLCLYHCLHSDYIRADKWSPKMSITYSNKGVYTGSTSKLINEDEFEMEFTGVTFSEGTQTLARDFLSGSSEITRTSADYAFTLRTEPNIFSPFQVEESFSPIPEAAIRSADETETNKYPPVSEPGTAPTVSQLRSEIEEEKRRAKRAEASLLEIMTYNRRHLADTPVFSDASEAKRAEERASAVYEKSKKELAVVTAAVTPSSSYGSSLSSSRGAHKPWSSRGSKVAPSNEPYGGLTPEPKILDWVPEHESVSSKSSRSMQLSGYRNVRTPNIMQVEPRPILETPPPAYDLSPVETQAKPIPVRVFRTDGRPVKMLPSVPSTPVTTSTINVLPSFNPFYTTAKKEHTSL